MARDARHDVLAMALILVVVADIGVFARAWRPAVTVQALPVAAAPAKVDRPVLVLPAAPAIDLDADAGSVVVASTGGTTMTPELRSLFVDGQVGGLLLFAGNIAGPDGLRAWAQQLFEIDRAACLEHPILLMIDQEGGSVQRVGGAYGAPSQAVAAEGGPAGVRATEAHTGAGLRSLGVGLDLAPVADVRYNQDDRVIGDRSFGSDPATVAPMVSAAVTGLHDGGVGATLKHFPGLGGAAGDPHVAIPTDPESEAVWERTQMPSFQAGINSGADAVMTTAVYVPGLGGGSTPAMFSAPVVGRLRTQLGFKGVIISDALNMGGVTELYTLDAATVAALSAGNDLLLLASSDSNAQFGALSSIRAAETNGHLDPMAIHRSAVRVNALRDRWGPTHPRCRNLRE
jgi:beta-N-acetylhexosaminidase